MQLNARHIELFKAAQNGDIDSLGALLELYRPGLYAVALRLMGFGSVAHDAVQETFIIAIIHIQKIKRAAALGAWLYRVLYNYCMMQKRIEKKLPLHSSLTAKEIDKAWIVDHEKFFDNIHANEQQIRAAITLLPEPLRLVVILRYFSRFNNYETIAEILSIPIGTVKSRLANAKMALFRLFKKAGITSHPLHQASESMTALFHELIENVYDNSRVRERYLHMHSKNMLVVANSGKKIRNGRQYWKKLIYEDLKYGSRMKPNLIFSSGNTTVIECENENSPDFPDFCPPNATIVYFHHQQSIYRMHIHDPR